MCAPEEDHNQWNGDEIDDIRGEVLDPKLVQVGCQEELRVFKSMGVYEYAEREKGGEGREWKDRGSEMGKDQ